MNHIQSQRGDGNGTPPGIRVSYKALAIMIPIATLLIGGMQCVRNEDLSMINARIAKAELDRCDGDLLIRQDLREVKENLRELNNKIDRLSERTNYGQSRPREATP